MQTDYRARVPQQSIRPRTDLREMLRQHIITRSLACMDWAAERRHTAMESPAAFAAYRKTVAAAVRGFYGPLPVGRQAKPPIVSPVSTFERPGFRIENVLFDSFPGWEVNATVYVPTSFQPPFPAVVVPVGHSGKQFPSYQLPCQYFARSGFLVVCFDPPGQSGEKRPGNDHFRDGVRDYLIGATSSRYFIADALRCLDYLESRRDVDLRRGIGMTGVSGGGVTTAFAALLDERIAVLGPSCCVSPLADLDIGQCYAGCPETHPWRRYAEGIDEVDLLCAAAPAPCLLMAGAEDEVFHLDETRQLAATVAQSYACAEVPDRFCFYIDSGGHDYSLRQAREFTRFLARWLCGDAERPLPDLPDATFALRPEEELRCHPRNQVNIRTRAIAEANALAAGRDCQPESIRRAAAELAGVATPVPVPESEIGEPFQVWVHDWRSVMLRPESGIELPGTLLTARQGTPAPAILHFDDRGRHRLLQQHGLLARAIRFLDRDRQAFNLLTIDLRGWGDTAPSLYPYELTGWGSVDRYLAYATAALGDPVLAMRMRDGLSALAWLETRPEVTSGRIVLTGCGLGGLVAFHVAAIHRTVAGVVVWEALSSFRSLLAAEQYPWPADAFLPRALQFLDLPELAASLPCPVRVYGLRAGNGERADGPELEPYRAAPNVTVTAESSCAQIVDGIHALLACTSSPATHVDSPGRQGVRES